MDASLKSSSQKNKNDLSKTRQGQRYVLYFLSVLAGSVVILWLWQMNYRLTEPFQASLSTDPVSMNEILLDAQRIDLRLVDTDGDGISDYDEIYIYGTSPYLVDTDGDGISDYDEIFVYGTDPLCPQGQDCSEDEFMVNPEANPNQQLNVVDGPEESLELNYLQPGQNISEDYEDIISQALTGDADPLILRQLLFESGLDPSLINQLSDEDLLNIYQEILNNQALP